MSMYELFDGSDLDLLPPPSIDFLRDYGMLDGEYLERVWQEIYRLRTVKSQYCEALKAQSALLHDLHGKLHDANSRISKLEAIEAAALHLINVKGRHHSEIAMQRLMEVCGK